MSYTEMIGMIDDYINSDAFIDNKWIELLQTCKSLIKDKINNEN